MKRLLALLLTLCCVFALTACGLPGKSGKQIPEINNTRWARISEEDEAVFYLGKDQTFVIRDAKDAAISPDRKTLVWLTIDGDLFKTAFKNGKTDLSARERLAEDVATLRSVWDKGVFYTLDDGMICRAVYDGAKGTELVADPDASAVARSLDFFYALDGKIYYLSASSNSPREVGSYSGGINFLAITRKGDVTIWADYLDEHCDIYCFSGGKAEKISTLAADYSWSANAMFNQAQDAYLVYSYGSDTFVFGQPGREAAEIKMPGAVRTAPYPSDAWISASMQESISEFYTLVGEYDNGELYWADVNSGDQEKLFSNVKDMDISGGVLFYLTVDGELYETKPEGAQTREGTRISKNVDEMFVPTEGGTVYYMKNSESVNSDQDVGAGTLYAYRSGDKDSIRVASDVYLYYYKSSYSDYVSSYMELTSADRGNSVFFLKDAQRDEDYNLTGTLYLYQYGKEEPARIMSNVVRSSLIGETSILSSKGFYFAKDTGSKNDDGNIIANWYYYDGKDVHLVVKNAPY